MAIQNKVQQWHDIQKLIRDADLLRVESIEFNPKRDFYTVVYSQWIDDRRITKLYYHKLEGIVRIDGDIEKDAELNIREEK